MKLQSLHIKGFKSFADKTAVHFNEDITGIVGPNGCGKSNIVDAMRWVLGEQKTSMLRSDKMENVIFNGSKARRTSQLAEVSLTFENTKNILPTEYSTVTITRILYRSGDSEYRINDVPCRLKDITSLFLDTGISSDSYAIIELSMIDEILNDKENSRRRLFEQAAGISKYKKRKKETFNKLNATEADLNRVEDLLYEIENNLKTLESQARKAKRYRTLKEEYKESSIRLATHILAAHKRSFENLESQKQQEEDKKLNIKTGLSKLESQLEKEKAENIEKQKHLSELQKQLNEHLDKLRQAENEKQRLAEKQKLLHDQNNNLTHSIAQSGEKIKELQQNIRQLSKGKSDEEEYLSAVKNELENLKAELEKARSFHRQQKENAEQHRQQLNNVQNQIYELEKKLLINRTQRENLEHTIKNSQGEQESREQEVKKLQKQLQVLEKEQQNKQKQVEALEQKHSAYQANIERAEKELEHLKEELRNSIRQLDARQNEYNLTKSFVHNLEGFPESIKFLKKNAAWAKNAPLLSDVLSCKDDFQVAIENYLDRYLSYYVVEIQEEAVQAVNLLSDASKGRAHFFILKDFENYQPKALPAGEHTISATEVIEVDNKYHKLAAFLLDNVYLIDDLRHLSLNGKPGSDSFIFLTKNGKYIRSAYSLSGGSVGLFEGKKIGRTRNLEKLTSEIKELEQTVNQLQQKNKKQAENLQELKQNNPQEQVRKEKEILNELHHRHISIKSRTEHLKEYLQSSESKKANAQQEIEEIEKANQQLEHQLQELNRQKNEAEQVCRQAEEDLRKADDQLRATEQRYNEKNIEYHRQENRFNSIRQEINYEEKQVQNLQNRLLQDEESKKAAAKEIDEIKERLHELENVLEGLYAQKTSKEAYVNRSEENYYESRGNIDELEKQIRELGKNENQMDVVLNSIKDKITDLKLQVNSLKERFSVEFNINIEELPEEEPNAGTSKEELQLNVEKLKNRLDNFGEINPMAVEAYDEMKERHDFIIRQKDDLVEAKNSLLQTIDEIEATATEKFLTAFEQARANFINVFHTLFTPEDDCNLILQNEEDPLESSIEIIAKPKGKRPLTINQLSGGEKALTALALLFALYLLKPAPFCILDEVDAPLDDTNIGKFNNMIRQFSQGSQFIIVTHNKQTMAAVDVIYGVTMAEEGVSKVVPVDFRSLKEAV